MTATAECAAEPTVVVIGSANVDLGMSLQRLPGPGETIAGGTLVRTVGGKGANQATAAAKLGARTYLVGAVGDDADGLLVRAELISSNVDLAFLRTTPEAPTGVALVFMSEAGENQIGVASGANALVTPAEVEQAIRAVNAQAAVVLACLEVPLATVEAAARTAAERGFAFVLNPAPAQVLPAELLSLTAVITPNEHELPLLGHGSARGLLRAGVKAVVATRGSAGVSVYTDEAEPVRMPAFSVDAVDTTGAGDAFSGTLAWTLAGGGTLFEAVALGNAAGALATRAPGARGSLATRGELMALAFAPTAPVGGPAE